MPWTYARWLRLLLKLKAAKSNTLVLTFDDGPGSRLTPAILDILAEFNVKATFFLLGRNIPGRERIVEKIAEQGHEICSHGYDHLNYWKVSPLRCIKDIKHGWQAINAVLGVRRKKYLFRPPNGKLNTISLLYLLVHRVPIVYWTLDLGDTWKQKPSSQMIPLLATKTDGAVILAHDFDRSNNSVDQFVLESIRSALSAAKKTDLQVLTVSELLNGQR